MCASCAAMTWYADMSRMLGYSDMNLLVGCWSSLVVSMPSPQMQVQVRVYVYVYRIGSDNNLFVD